MSIVAVLIVWFARMCVIFLPCCVCVCVCVCVSVRALTVAILSNFDKIWHRRPERETKEPFLWGSKSINGIPYFYPILPQIGTHKMHFQWET